MTESVPTVELFVERVFDAPRSVVYRAFTDPDQLAQWFGPVGWSVPRDSVDMDARVGGHQRFVMVNDADPNYRSPVDAKFTEVIENELLVGTEDFQPSSAPRPAPMQMRIEFHDEDGGKKTRLVLRQGPYTAEWQGRALEGWTSSFTKLDELLGRRPKRQTMPQSLGEPPS